MSMASAGRIDVRGLVAELLSEIGPTRPDEAIGPNSLLEEDLGIYSLERLELMLRLEQRYGVQLAEDAAIQATTVGDLERMVGGTHLPEEKRTASEPLRLVEACGPPGSLAFSIYAGALVVAIGAGVWPLLHLMRPGPRAARLLRAGARALFRAAGCRIDVSGVEHLVDVHPVVFVANHQSYLDSLVLLAALPILPNIVVNERLPRAPFVGTAIRAARFLAVDRRTLRTRLAFADAMRAALGSGESLLVFPEATFDRGPDLLPFRLGAFAAAAAVSRPLIPVSVAGTREMLPCDAILLRRSRLSVTIHPPLRPRGAGWAEALRLRDAARACIAAARHETGV